MKRRVRVVLVLAAVVLAPDRVAAQSRFGGELRGLVSVSALERTQSGIAAELDGTLIGGGAAVRFAFLELRGRYLQGTVEQEGGTTAQDLVDGDLQLRVRPVRFLSIGFGPHARSYVEAGTERWLVWQARAGLDVWLVPNVVRGALDLALGLGGNVNSGAEFGAGRGVTGGLELRVPGTPIFVGVGYSLDRLSLRDDTRVDTVEQFLVRAGVWP